MTERILDTNKLNKVIKYLLDNRGEHHESQIAEDLDIRDGSIREFLEMVKRTCPKLIQLRDTGKEDYYAEIQADAVTEATKFLSSGGFNKLARAMEVQKQEKREIGKRKLRHLAATALGAEQAITDAKIAKTLAIWSLVVSCFALVIGILAFTSSTNQ